MSMIDVSLKVSLRQISPSAATRAMLRAPVGADEDATQWRLFNSLDTVTTPVQKELRLKLYSNNRKIIFNMQLHLSLAYLIL